MAPVTAAVQVVTPIVPAARIQQAPAQVPAVVDVLLVPVAAEEEAEEEVGDRITAIDPRTAIDAATPAPQKTMSSMWMIPS